MPARRFDYKGWDIQITSSPYHNQQIEGKQFIGRAKAAFEIRPHIVDLIEADGFGDTRAAALKDAEAKIKQAIDRDGRTKSMKARPEVEINEEIEEVSDQIDNLKKQIAKGNCDNNCTEEKRNLKDLESKLKKLGKERQGERSIKERLVSELISAEDNGDELETAIIRAKIRKASASNIDSRETSAIKGSVRATSRKELLREKSKLNEESFKVLAEKKKAEARLDEINERINEIAEELYNFPDEE